MFVVTETIYLYGYFGMLVSGFLIVVSGIEELNIWFCLILIYLKFILDGYIWLVVVILEV